jgi:hypothetical protein
MLFCKKVLANVSIVSSLDGKLAKGVVIHCLCDKTNLPFVVCLSCHKASPQRRHLHFRIRYQGWYHKHFTNGIQI